ncbi:MAG: alpha/beta fold hydrolase [Deltaproteobacteria bacterium]|nr:alpha/beta fold hydrolase [Deltaproteobacteria bacterium]
MSDCCEEFELSVDGNTLRGKIYCPSPGLESPKGSLIFCHGIPGALKAPHDPGYAQLAGKLSKCGYLSVTFNFRGAGESSGDFDILGWVIDLKSVLNYIARLCPSSITLFGFSAGAAVSVYVAAHDGRVSRLVICGCPADFDSILNKIKADTFLQRARDVGIIRNPAFPLNHIEWARGFRVVKSEEWISHIKSVPKLILHGNLDDTVPVDHAHRLYDNAQQPKELLIIEGGGHRLRLNPQAMAAAQKWLARTSE